MVRAIQKQKSVEKTIFLHFFWWSCRDSNPGPDKINNGFSTCLFFVYCREYAEQRHSTYTLGIGFSFQRQHHTLKPVSLTTPLNQFRETGNREMLAIT